MNKFDLSEHLKGDLELAEKAIFIFEKSVKKSKNLLKQSKGKTLDDDQRETLESLTSRFGRALDILTQKLLRTIDKIELTDEGSVLDRINRFKKRKVLREDINYGLLKDLRNRIVHEYIVEESDSIVQECLQYANILVEIYHNASAYCKDRGFV